MLQSTVIPETLEAAYCNRDYRRMMYKVFKKFDDLNHELFPEISLSALEYTLLKYNPAKSASFKTLLTRNMRNQCGMKRRELNSQRRKLHVRFEGDISYTPNKTVNAVRDAIYELASDQQEYLCQKYLSGVPDEDIRVSMGLSERAYYQLVLRAEKDFKYYFQGEGGNT